MQADSVGGIVECAVTGLPVGLGEPMFGGMEGRIAQIVYGIPAVKGVEFGAGFHAAELRGSENNDPYEVSSQGIRTSTNRIAQIVYGIPAVKGVEFGAGFHAAELRGSENNDPYEVSSQGIRTSTNHSGGILGGITNGMPLILRAAFKPTPSTGSPMGCL